MSRALLKMEQGRGKAQASVSEGGGFLAMTMCLQQETGVLTRGGEHNTMHR